MALKLCARPQRLVAMTTKLNGLGRNPDDNGKALSDTTRGYCTVARKLYDTARKLYDTTRKRIFSELRGIGE